LPASAKRTHDYKELPAGSLDCGALPVSTVEPDSLANSSADGSVILFDLIDRKGEVTSTQELYGSDSLTPAAEAAARRWRFAPGKNAGKETDSASVVVVMFRRTVVAGNAASSRKTQ